MGELLLKYMKTKKLLLTLILLLAFVVRVYHLGSLPPSLTPDEASLGYNAYSILRTGKDEYGVTLPLIFKSFGDYKPGLYVYATVPSIALFGLNEFATRLPSALSGVLAVFILYLISQLLFSKTLEARLHFKNLPLITSFLLAICPWHIFLSRGAWEVNLALTLTLAGIYFFLLALKTTRMLYISAVFFALTLWTYQGAKLSTAIVLAILIILWWRELFSFKKTSLFVAFIVGLLFSLPIIISIFQMQTGRLAVFSVFSYPRPENYLESQLSQGNETIGSLSYYLYHPESLNFLRGILGRYFNHFSGRFLFFDGDWQNPRHTAPNQGVLYLADAIFIILGAKVLLQKYKKKEILFVLLWLALSPMPAALSRDQVHAVRSFQMVVPLVMLVGIGLNSISKKAIILVVTLYVFSIIYFIDAYTVHLPIHNAKYWQWGYKQLVEAISSQQKNYNTVYIEQSYEQPYIYFLFYQQYDPAKYQSKANLTTSTSGDVGQVLNIDNLMFSTIDWQAIRHQNNILIATSPSALPQEFIQNKDRYEVVKSILYPNGIDQVWTIISHK